MTSPSIHEARYHRSSFVMRHLVNPLTLMLGPTEDALSSPDKALSGESLVMVRRNALRLMKLVNSLLDFPQLLERALSL